MIRTFYIKTLGCQMNVYDSDRVARILVQKGLTPATRPEQADLVLVNTCTVRAKPEQKAASFLGRIGFVKSRRPGLVVGVLGCLAQQYGKEILRRFPQVDFVMGPREAGRIGEVLEEIRQGRRGIQATRLDMGLFGAPFVEGYFRGRLCAFISVMEGCDNFCSYCIVPYVRGREVSRAPQEILQEVDSLLREGVREVTLLGQNVNSYRFHSEGERWDFPRLLKEVGAREGLWRLRFTTSHPKDLTEELMDCFVEVPSLCPHIHLPFQAGSNRVLRAMNRGYTREEYLEKVRRLRDRVPDVAITSDVMVGFPGEEEEDFQMTLELIEEVGFDGLYSFVYSDRRGTVAEKMGEKIPPEEKQRRLLQLQALQKRLGLEKNRSFEGQEVVVLVDGMSKRGGQYSGRSHHNKIVNFESDKNHIGKLVKVKVTQGLLNSLRGEFRGEVHGLD